MTRMLHENLRLDPHRRIGRIPFYFDAGVHGHPDDAMPGVRTSADHHDRIFGNHGRLVHDEQGLQHVVAT